MFNFTEYEEVKFKKTSVGNCSSKVQILHFSYENNLNSPAFKNLWHDPKWNDQRIKNWIENRLKMEG